MNKPTTRIPLLLALAASACALLSACLQDRAGDERTEAWSGTIRDDCGSAGGHVVSMWLSPSQELGCLDEGFAGDSRQVLLDSYRLDSLKVGMVLPFILECPDKCLAADSIRLKIERLTEEAVSGSMEIRQVPYDVSVDPMPVKQGSFILKKCPGYHGPCF